MLQGILKCHGVVALADVHYTDYTDGQLAGLVKEGNSEAFAELTARYMFLVRAKATPFHSTQIEIDDLCQEGLLGLLSAARTYDASNRASFRTYAGVCIANRVIMAYRSAASRKNRPLSDFVSLSESGAPELSLPGVDCDPEALLSDSENVRMMWQRMKAELSPLELQVLQLYLSGYSYGEISERLSITTKAADNALQRVRAKLKNRIGGPDP